MCENREGVYTQLATTINSFVQHKLTKIEFYKQISGLIEIADENEKNDRLRYKDFWKKVDGIIPKETVTYSNWKDGLDIVDD